MTRPALGSLGAGLVLVALLGRPAAAEARQDVPAAQPADTVPASPMPPADTVVVDRPSPGGAFVRSLLVPGWGQATFGAHARGAIYVAAQGGSGYMMLKTVARVGEARDMEDRFRALAADSLRAEMEADPELAEELASPQRFLEAVDADPRVREAESLVQSRRRQREDWITWTVFWTLASAVDAFVNAHLADFPAAINAEPAPGGAVRLQLSLPVGGVR